MQKISWSSLYGKIDVSIFYQLEQTLGYELPNSLKVLYEAGDGPFAEDSGGRAPAYPLSHTRDSVDKNHGFALSFFTICQSEKDEDLLCTYLDFSARFPEGFVPVARDGGGELLLLRYKGRSVSVWHYCPSDRLGPSGPIIRVADDFEQFLQKIEFF